MEYNLEQLTAAMIRYDSGDPQRIHHFLKVRAFARQIGVEEGLDTAALFTLETTALVHDIGIRKAEELYGSSAGHYQEELGPAEADALLTPLNIPRNVIDRVMYLVGHHHTYANIDGLDYQILVEADFLVNVYEDNITPEAGRNAYLHIFRTETGKQLFRELYPSLCE